MSINAIQHLQGRLSTGILEPQVYILVDENGVEIPAVLSEEKVTLTATANDIREGTVAITDCGVTVGEKFIPPYYTSVGWRIIMPGNECDIPLSIRDAFDYTALQCIICPFSTSMTDSVSAEKIVIEGNVYETKSTAAISVVSKDAENKTVNLGITNESDTPYIIRYFTYKEEA